MSSHCHLWDHCHLSHHCHFPHHHHFHLRDHCHPRDHCHIRDLCHAQNWKHIQRQMRMLDLRLQLLRDRLCAARLHKCLPCCYPHHHHHSFRCPGRRALTRAKILGMLLGSSCCHHPCIDKCFDPGDVCVSVKDGRVTMSAEHKDECNTGLSKSCNYRRFTKEFSLPPGEEEVTYSEECNNLTKIEPPKCCPHLCNF